VRIFIVISDHRSVVAYLKMRSQYVFLGDMRRITKRKSYTQMWRYCRYLAHAQHRNKSAL